MNINLFVIVPLFIGAVFVFIVGSIVVNVVSNLSAPRLDRPARVVAKRMEVRANHAGAQAGPTSQTFYFATFEFDDGSREELAVRSNVYGLLVEGDSGRLRSQGTWFKGFDRA